MKKATFCLVIVIAVLTLAAAPLSAAKVYWSDDALNVHRINTDGTGQQTLPVSGVNFIGGLAIDPVTQKLYWSESGATDKIQRSNLDGSGIEDVITAGLGDPRGLTIDQTQGRLFWVDKQINWVTQAMLANFAATGQLFVSNGGTHIVLDTLNGKIYWLKNQIVQGMASGNMDGSGIVDDIISGGGVMTSPEGLAIDPAAGKLYWTDIGGVWWSDLDGNNRVKIVTLPASSTRGIALDIAGGKMYFGFQDKIMEAGLDGTNPSDFLTGLASNPKHLVLDDSGPPATQWTYQGELKANGSPVNDTAAMRFSLWTSGGGGAQVGANNVLNTVDVVGGRFTVLLDFTAGAFAGKRWLQIEVMGSGDADFILLSPRQLITPAPLALDAVNEHGHSSLDAADGNPTEALMVDNEGKVKINGSVANRMLGVRGGFEVFDDLGEGINLTSDNLVLAEGTSEDLVYEYQSAPDTHKFYTDGSQRVTILANGNVGIGDTTPGARLEVAGGETILEQEPWQTPIFENGWVNYIGTFNSAGYFKDSLGVVHLRGLVKNGTIGQPVFTLPVGYRPGGRGIFPSVSNNALARIDIDSAGVVLIQVGSNVWISLEGITFRAEQ